MFKADATQIRRRANLLPIKGMLYAISHAIADPSIKADAKGASSRRKINGLSKHFSKLYLIASGYGNPDEDDPSELLSTITSAVRSYTSLFYLINRHNRTSYIERHSNGIGRRIAPERNLLLIPAMMAAQGKRRSLACSTIIKGLYSMPARFLYGKCMAALKVEQFQQGLGLKGGKEHALSRLSLSMEQLQSLIERIDSNDINPQSDEMVKELFVNEIVSLSESDDIPIAEFISDRLSNGNISFRTALGMVRK